MEDSISSLELESMRALREKVVQLSEELSVFYRRAFLPKEWSLADLTMPQLKALLAINDEGTCSMSHLAASLGVALPTATGIVERLVERDLVSRLADPSDRRVVRCKLSGNGNRLIERLWEVRKDLVEDILQPLTAEDLRIIAEAFTILCGAIQGKTKDWEIQERQA